MLPPVREKTLASTYSLNRERHSNHKICKKELTHSAMAGSVINMDVSLDTQGEEEKEEDNAMAKVKLEKEEENGLLVTCGFQKRKRLSRGGGQKNKQLRLGTTRWNTERIMFAEQTLAEVMKDKGASFETPISRFQLRTIARKKICDTGLLDHSLKHIDGKVTPGGVDRFRRCYNTDGTMEYWLESADLVKIKRDDWLLPSWRKIQTASDESSAVSSKLLMEEIEEMKSDIKELALKQKLRDRADSTEKLYKDFMNWRVKTDKQIVEISSLLTSTQCMFKELSSWKYKVEQQLVGISNSLNNLQANGSTSFRPAESWEHILTSANLDDFTGNGFESWDDFIDGLPEAVRPDTYSLPPNPFKRSLQDNTWVEEHPLVNIEMQMTESCMTRGESRSSNQDKAEMTPGSAMTAGPKSDIDDSTILSQETLKELGTWKAKAEQQLTEISNAVFALKGQSQPTGVTREDTRHRLISDSALTSWFHLH